MNHSHVTLCRPQTRKTSSENDVKHRQNQDSTMALWWCVCVFVLWWCVCVVCGEAWHTLSLSCSLSFLFSFPFAFPFFFSYLSSSLFFFFFFFFFSCSFSYSCSCTCSFSFSSFFFLPFYSLLSSSLHANKHCIKH